jgi:hypothetical protein
MLFEELLIVVGIPFLLVLVGFIASRAELVVIGGIGLLVAGVLIFASPLVVEYNVNHTAELSHVWNCSDYTNGTCLGTPHEHSCMTYNETQCRGIAKCEWNGQSCEGTPELTCHELFLTWGVEKCLETDGCYVESLSNPQTCDSYDVTYTYSGVEIDPNNNLILGTIIAFLGLLCLGIGAVTLRG